MELGVEGENVNLHTTNNHRFRLLEVRAFMHWWRMFYEHHKDQEQSLRTMVNTMYDFIDSHREYVISLCKDSTEKEQERASWDCFVSYLSGWKDDEHKIDYDKVNEYVNQLLRHVKVPEHLRNETCDDLGVYVDNLNKLVSIIESGPSYPTSSICGNLVKET